MKISKLIDNEIVEQILANIPWSVIIVASNMIKGTTHPPRSPLRFAKKFLNQQANSENDLWAEKVTGISYFESP